MIEANIIVPRKIWIDAQRYSFRYSAFIDLMKFYSWKFLIIWFVVAVVDGIANQGPLISKHFMSLFTVWIIACIIGYIQWYLRLQRTVNSYSFYARLDNTGVYATYPEQFIPWKCYYSITDRGNYYLIRGENGISVLPKNEEFKQIIQFSLQEIPNK